MSDIARWTAVAKAGIHHHRVMEKMGAASIADLVRMAEHLALYPVPPSERS